MEDRPEYDTSGYLYAVGTVYPQIWANNDWQNHPYPTRPGWQNYIGYAGNREVLPSKGFEYTGPMGGPIQILGTGLAVPPGKFRVSILSAIARDWVVHYPSTGKNLRLFHPGLIGRPVYVRLQRFLKVAIETDAVGFGRGREGDIRIDDFRKQPVDQFAHQDDPFQALLRSDVLAPAFRLVRAKPRSPG